jgi:SAM-dependent methyltransferase
VSDGPTNDDVRSAWDANAPFWDARMVEPDSWQQTLVFPVVERLLAVRRGERILEIACGNGLLAQRIADAGAEVLATDYSEQQLAFARRRVSSGAVRLMRLDATSEDELRPLGPGRFDAVVASMALMDIRDIGPLANALPTVLVEGGRFVFAVTHPAFNNVSAVPTVERRARGTGFVDEHSLRVSTYARPRAVMGAGIAGQPREQWYFDRSLSDLLRPFLRAGLVLDALEEPVFDTATAERFDERALWTEIPPVLAARLRAT